MAATKPKAKSKTKPIVVADPDNKAGGTGKDGFVFHDENFRIVKVKVKVDGKPTVEERPIPYFSVQDVAKFFFGRTADWLRWRYQSDEKTDKKTGKVTPARHPDGFFVLDGVPLKPKTSVHGYRYYTLADVERMAHALARNEAIDGDELNDVMTIIKANAKIWSRRH
jgi:hypothetical protein